MGSDHMHSSSRPSAAPPEKPSTPPSPALEQKQQDTERDGDKQQPHPARIDREDAEKKLPPDPDPDDPVSP